MSSSVSTVDVAPAAAGADEPPPEDGWRSGGLPALRAELDRIDDTVHDLLMQRAEIVEHAARSGKPAAFRPGREAAIIRRLLDRHRGALPPVALVRIWRELLAGTTAMQGNVAFSVCDPRPDGPLTQLAREHFGVLTPLRSHASCDLALSDVSRGLVSVAVLPYPSETATWWIRLLRHEPPLYIPPLYIIARLPFWTPRPEGFPNDQAVVVGSTLPDASQDDRSFIGLECDPGIGQALLADQLTKADLPPESIIVARLAGSSVSAVLVEVAGTLSADDERLRRLDPVARRPIVLGGYAMPVAGFSK